MKSLGATPLIPPAESYSSDDRVQKILRRHKQMEREKQPWLSTYQLCGEYIFLRRQDFTRTLAPGQFLTGRIFDATAPRVLHHMASALIGALWPGGQKVFQIKPPKHMSKQAAAKTEVKEYYRKVSELLMDAMSNPLAGLPLVLEECFNDLGAFGISGVGVFSGDSPNLPLRFVAIDTKKLTIDEDQYGRVDTVYIKKEVSVRQLVQEYGLNNVSKVSREKYLNGTDQGFMADHVKVLHAIEPRQERTGHSFGNANFPIASIHIEITENHILKESGFHDMPVFVPRFYKAMNEKYGRSPGMEAMPDILEINAMREAMIIAVEKMLNPPLAVTQDGAAGGGTINTSAGATNVRTINGRIGDGAYRWIEPIITVGDIKPAKERIGEIERIIGSTFLMEILTDVNRDDPRMTLGEVNIKEKRRGQGLGTVISRLTNELFNPIVTRGFNIMLDMELLGVHKDSDQAIMAIANGEDPFIIPDDVLELMQTGKDAYDIEYLTPAARIMRSEELMGVQQVVGFIETMGKSGFPQAVDNIDEDKLVERLVELTGCPADVVRDGETMAAIRKARSESQQQAQAVEQGHITAQTARGYGQASEAAAKAGLPPEMMLPQPPQPQGQQ